MKQTTLAVLTGLFLSCPAHAASFDCVNSKTRVEKLICADAELSGLDEDLAELYTAVQRFNDKAASVRQTQKQWLKARNGCTDANCVKDAYTARLQELSLEQTSGYRMMVGNGYTICEEMLKRMNEELARNPQGPVCGYDVLRSIPGVTLPDWTRVDLHEHKALYKRYALARRVNDKDWDVAFAEPPPKAGQKLAPNSDRELAAMPSEEMLERDWQDAVDGKVAFYKWDDPWPTQEDTDIMLIRIWPGTEKHCTHSSATLFEGDLKRPRIGSGWHLHLYKELPFKFAGRHYLMSEGIPTNGTNGPIIDDFFITWVSEDSRRKEHGPTEICRLRRN